MIDLETLAQDRDEVICQSLRKARGHGHPELLAEALLLVASNVAEALHGIAAEVRALREEIASRRPFGEAEPAPPIAGSPVLHAVLALVATAPDGLVEGAAAELLARLEALAPEPRGRLWPTGPRSLSVTLRRLAPELHEAGVVAAQGSGANRRTWSLRRVVPAAIAADEGGAEPAEEGRA